MDEFNLTKLQKTQITKCYRMFCAMVHLQKKDAEEIQKYFEIGGYDISRSRVMNLLSQDDSMTVQELYSFMSGFKKENSPLKKEEEK